MKRAVICTLIVLLGLAGLLAASGPQYYVSGWHAIVKEWRPQIEQHNRRVEIPIDTNGAYKDVVFVRGPTPLALPTTVAEDDRCLHPDWLYVPGGWNDYSWWLVYTPYPATDSAEYEEPHLVCANDPDGTWAAPSGLTNPVVENESGFFLSDPCINIENDLMYLYYRIVNTPDADNADIVCQTSADGVNWSTATVVVNDVDPSLIRSPIVRNVNGTYWMWTQDENGGSEVMTWRTSSSPTGGFGSPTDCTLNGMGGEEPWHVNVQYDRGLFIVLITTMNLDLYLGTSQDGKTFDCQCIYDAGTSDGSWDDAEVYQAGLVVNEDGSLEVVYGAEDGTDYYIGHGKVLRQPSKSYDQNLLDQAFGILNSGNGCELFVPFVATGKAPITGARAAATRGTYGLAFSATGAVIDYSLKANDFTPSEAWGAFDTAPILRNVANTITFNGTDEYISRADDTDFEFGDGSDNVAFCVGAFVKRATGSSNYMRIITKRDVAGSQQEWTFGVDDSDKAFIWTTDQSESAIEGRISTNALPDDEWVFVGFVTTAGNGDSISDDYLYYQDGLVTASGAADSGSGYTAMEAGTSKIGIGCRHDSGTASGLCAFELGPLFVVRGTITPQQWYQLFLILQQVVGNK